MKEKMIWVKVDVEVMMKHQGYGVYITYSYNSMKVKSISFFPVLKPSMNELHDCDKVFMTPDSSKWSPYSTEYSTKEMAMIDFNGNLIIDDALEKIKKGQKIYPVDDSTYIISTCNVDDYNKGMDLVLDSSYIQSNDSNISGFDFSDVISQRCEISKVAISIGAVSAESGNNLFSPYFSWACSQNSPT